MEEFGIPAGHPIGLGFRVPLIIVSPWTRGHLVYSQVSDHMSVVKLMEARFGVMCPNISPWRRAMTSDLSAAFDFESPDYSWPTFPSTSQNVNQSKWVRTACDPTACPCALVTQCFFVCVCVSQECDNLPAPSLPTVQSMPVQEPGTRVSRPLPYEFVITDAVSAAGVTITLNNTGAAGAHFLVFDLTAPSTQPRKYSVEGGKALSDDWPLASSPYNLSVYGPNGFVRSAAGNRSTALVSSYVKYDRAGDNVVVVVGVDGAAGSGKCAFTVTDNSYGSAGSPWMVSVTPGSSAVQAVPVAASGNWYDLTVSLLGNPECPVSGLYTRRFMGHMENGKVTTSDPAMAKGEPLLSDKVFADVPLEYRTPRKWSPNGSCSSRRSRMKDACWTAEEEAAMIAAHTVEL